MTKYKNKHILTISKKCIYFLKVGDNMLYDYLVNNYEKGEPIFLMDIVIKGMTEENIRYHLKKMTDEGIIDRFDSGIYYIPRINIFGEKSTISAETVALHKYVYRRGKRVGFYSGYTLANRLGLSTQVPIKEEITSNYAPAQVREVSIKNQKYLIRDSGSGFTDGRKDIIDEMLLHYDKKQAKLEGNSIGILNVQKRIKLLCGPKYGLSYMENETGGVTARLLLPHEEDAK